MPNAVITQTAYAGNGTQAGLLNAFSSAMVTAGFTLLDSYVNAGNENRVWSFVADAGKTFGTMIVELGFSAATTLRMRGFSSFDTATDAGSNASTVAPTHSATLTNNFNFYAFNHPEMRGVMFAEASTIRGFIGYFRPTNVPSGWNENTSPYGFIPGAISTFNVSNGSNGFQTISSLKPAAVGAGNTLTFPRTTNARSNLLNGGTRTIQVPATIVDFNRPCDLAIFSTDIGFGASDGMSFLDTTLSGSTEYAFIEGGTGGNSDTRMFIKVV